MTTTNASLLERRKKAVPRGVSTAHPVFAARARNAEIWDVEGRRFIDFAGGIGVQNFGHCHPDVVAAITAQAQNVIHSAFQVTAYESYIALAEEMNRRAPINGPVKTIFFSTGAEAGENAVKISRAATKRAGVISFVGGFHGRSLLAMTLTGKVLPYKKTFGPMAGSVFHAPFPMAYHGVSVDDAIHGIERIFKASIDPSEVAAIMFETVQGEGGFYQAPLEFIQRIREICDKHGILMVADEVRCEAGRYRDGEEYRRGTPPLGGHRPRRRYGRPRAGRSWRYLRREPGRVRGGARDLKTHGPGESPRAKHHAR
jgi:4-aminobutyrate aminotransferase/(S)-3-amino-2-methylpropionate transaminase